jgi:hypothetical protein
MKNPEPNYRARHAWYPLVPTTDREALLRKHLDSALGKMRGASISMPEKLRHALPFLQTSPMLPPLKQLQERYDPDGPLRVDLSSENFRLAMTLRDCTMFKKVSSVIANA